MSCASAAAAAPEHPTIDANFISRAQATLDAAPLLAEVRGHSYVGVEHLLLPLIHSGPSIATAALTRCDVNVDELSAAFEWLMPPPQEGE